MPELKPCPFCEGSARLSAKDHLFGGWNVDGRCKREYLIKVICNRCHSRGKPITTGWVFAPYYNRKSCFTSEDDKQKFYDAERKAVDAWNRRKDDEK